MNAAPDTSMQVPEVIEATVLDTDLARIGNALTEYSKVDAGLAELRERYKGVTYDVITREGMAAAVASRRVIRDIRVRVEEVRKDAKAPILALGRRLDTEAKRITSELTALEEPIDTQIKAEEKRREEERRAREEAERARTAEIQKRIAIIEAMPERYADAASDKIAEAIGQLEAGLKFDYQEFAPHAEAARQAAIVALRTAHVEALEREQKAAEEAAERARRDAAAQATREAEEARRAAEREREEAEARAAREAEEQRLAAERKELETLRAEQRRVEAIRERLAELAPCPALSAGSDPDLIAGHVSDIEALVIDETFAEFRAEAEARRAQTLETLRTLLAGARARVASEKRLQEEREQLARERAEIEARERTQREADERAARAADEAREKQLRRAVMLARGRPSASEIADVVAEGFGVDADIAAAWIWETPQEQWADLAAPAPAPTEAA